MADSSPSDLGECSGRQLSELYREREASPVEATRAALERIDRVNPRLNAFVHVDADGALEAARASARRWGQGQARSALDGLPVSIKDLTEVRGMPAREGSATTEATPSEEDSPPVARLREAGAVLLGKTNTPEFGWKAVTDNPLFGTTYNPWSPRLTPGGSSGGAAVAAALNLGVLHQGGDSGGSIRIPASFSGVFGLKPTFGWVPQWPPSKMASLSQIGPLARTVDDAALMLNAIGRYSFRDPYAVRGQPEDWGAALGEGLEGLRIAYSPALDDAEVEPDVAARVVEAADVLAELGADVERVGGVIEDPIETFRRLWFVASQEVESQLTSEQRERMDRGLRNCARRGEAYTGLDLFRAQIHRTRLAETLEHFFQAYDLLLTPSVPIPPFDASANVPAGSGESDWMEWTPFSYPFNLSGQPAASVPCGFTREGLPVGFQLAAGKYDDLRILRAARAYLEARLPRFPKGIEGEA